MSCSSTDQGSRGKRRTGIARSLDVVGCSQSSFFALTSRMGKGTHHAHFRLPRYQLFDRLAFGAGTDRCGRHGDHSSTRCNAIAVSAAGNGSTEPLGLTAPILLRFPLHRWRVARWNPNFYGHYGYSHYPRYYGSYPVYPAVPGYWDFKRAGAR